MASVEGEAVPIYIKQNDDEVHRIVKDNILKILSQDGVDDCKIMILSVTGAMREGKSFILNMFIRFLESGRSDNWMNSNETNLTGFSWRGGTKSNTMGILMWSKPYFSTLLDGTKVAIFLIDTQGAFDNENDLTQSSKIITMSLAISSHMIYNVNKCLRSDKLELFEMFVEHARMAEGLHGKSFFQTLLFLIRDWPDRDEHSCGAKGGEIYVNEQLSRGSQDNVRKENFKKKMFEQVGGFLLPHPGKKVAQSRQEQFNGAFEDKISLKKFNDKPIHGRELAEFALQFSKMLESDNLPTPKDFVEAQIEAAKNNLVIEFGNKFKSKMKQNMGESPFLKNTEFAQMAKSAENEIIAELEGRAFYGGDESKKEAMESVKLHIKNDIGELSDRNLAIEAECRIDYDKYIDEKKKELSDILRKKFSHYVKEIKIKDSCKEYESVILGKHFDGIKRRVEDFEAEYTSKIKNMIKQLCDDVVLQNTNNLKVMQQSLDLQINDIYEEAKVKLSEILQQKNIKDSSQADLILKQIVDDTTEKSVLADIPKTKSDDRKIKLREKIGNTLRFGINNHHSK
ncbi:atlastin-2-like [Styela clava]